jgi:hypothetical protein
MERVALGDIISAGAWEWFFPLYMIIVLSSWISSTFPLLILSRHTLKADHKSLL